MTKATAIHYQYFIAGGIHSCIHGFHRAVRTVINQVARLMPKPFHHQLFVLLHDGGDPCCSEIRHCSAPMYSNLIACHHRSHCKIKHIFIIFDSSKCLDAVIYARDSAYSSSAPYDGGSLLSAEHVLAYVVVLQIWIVVVYYPRLLAIASGSVTWS